MYSRKSRTCVGVGEVRSCTLILFSDVNLLLTTLDSEPLLLTSCVVKCSRVGKAAVTLTQVGVRVQISVSEYVLIFTRTGITRASATFTVTCTSRKFIIRKLYTCQTTC